MSLGDYSESVRSMDSKSVQLSSSLGDESNSHADGGFPHKLESDDGYYSRRQHHPALRASKIENRSCMSRLANASNGFFSRKFRALGLAVGSNPFRVILVSVVVAAALASE